MKFLPPCDSLSCKCVLEFPPFHYASIRPLFAPNSTKESSYWIVWNSLLRISLFLCDKTASIWLLIHSITKLCGFHDCPCQEKLEMFYVMITLLRENCNLLALGNRWGRHEDLNHSSHEGDGNEIKQRSPRRDKDYCSLSFFLEPFPNDALEIEGWPQLLTRRINIKNSEKRNGVNFHLWLALVNKVVSCMFIFSRYNDASVI